MLLNPNFTTFGCFLKCWYPQIIHFNRVFHYKPSILGYPYFWKHHSKIHLGPMGAWDIPIGPTFETWTRLRGSLHKHTGGKPQKQWNVWNGFCREHIMCIYIYIPSYMKNILAPKETALVTSYFPRLRRFRTVFFDNKKLASLHLTANAPWKLMLARMTSPFWDFIFSGAFVVFLGRVPMLVQNGHTVDGSEILH